MGIDRTISVMTKSTNYVDRRHNFLSYLVASSIFLLLFAVFLTVLRIPDDVMLFLLVPLVCCWCLSTLLFYDELRAGHRRRSTAGGAGRWAKLTGLPCSSAEKQLRPALLFTPVWTLALLKPVVFQLYAMGANLKAKRVRLGSKIPNLQSMAPRLLLLFCSAYALSLVINYHNAGSTGRFIGGLYNLSIWVMGFLLLAALARAGTLKGFQRWLRGLAYFGLITSSVTCIGLLAWEFGVHTLQIVSPFLPRSAQHSSLAASAWISFVYPGWFYTVAPRSASIVNYATHLGFVIVATILATILVARNRRWSLLTLSLFLAPQFVALAVSQGRTAVAALCLAAIHTFFYTNRRKTLLLLAGSVAAVVALWFIAPNMFLNLLKSLIYGARNGSAAGRFAIYAGDIAVWRQNPILGFGYKVFDWQNMGSFLSLGSESTYLGVLTKTGLLGTLPFLAFLLALYFQWHSLGKRMRSGLARSHWLYLGATLVVFAMLMLTEDLDATQVVPFIFFVTAGYTLALVRLSKDLAVRRP